MANLKNYGTNIYPVIALDPAASADTSTPTPYLRYEQALVSLSAMIANLQSLLTGGTVGNTAFFGTGVTGTEGDISYNVTGSKEHDTYLNTSSFNFYTAKAANVWNYLGNLRGPAGAGITAIEINSSGHLVVTIGNGSPTDLGKVVGDSGNPGAGSGWTVATDSTSGSVSYELSHGAYKVFTDSAVSAVTLTSGLSNTGDTCCVEFSSPSTASTYTKPTGCKHFGDDCDSSGDFTPAASTTYLLTFLKTYGGLKCFVKSM